MLCILLAYHVFPSMHEWNLKGRYTLMTCGTMAVFGAFMTGRCYWKMNIEYNSKLNGQISNLDKRIQQNLLNLLLTYLHASDSLLVCM